MRVLSAVLLAVFSLGAFAQQTNQTPPSIPAPGDLHIPPSTRVVEGKVTSADGAPLAKATVLLKDTKTLQVRSYISQQDGAYRFYGLSTDVNYEIRAEAGDLTSPVKQISVFNSHKLIKVDLKVKDKKKLN